MILNVVIHRAYNGETLNLLLNIQYWINGVSSLRTGVTGESPVVSIQRLSDSKYWNGSSWQVVAITVSMSEYDSTNFPGMYRYILTAGNDTYFIRYKNTGTYALDMYELYISGDYSPVVVSNLKIEFSDVRKKFKNIDNLLNQILGRLVDVEKQVYRR